MVLRFSTILAAPALVLSLCSGGLAQVGGPGLAALTNSSASYIYLSPTGAHTDISSYTGVSSLVPVVNTHSSQYDYPIQYTDGTHGTTTFDDFHWYSRTDQWAVPNITSTGGFFPSTGSDGHLIVVDTSTRIAYDFWRLCSNGSGTPTTCSGNYSATSVGYITAFSLNDSNGAPGGGTASELSGIVGNIMPGELNGGAIPHALSVVLPSSMMNPNVCTSAPASGTDGSVTGAVFCEGARIRMDPSVDVDSLAATPAAKSIMKALQLFGGIITDQSSCSSCMVFYSTIPGSAPDLTGLSTNLLAHIWIYYSN